MRSLRRPGWSAITLTLSSTTGTAAAQPVFSRSPMSSSYGDLHAKVRFRPCRDHQLSKRCTIVDNTTRRFTLYGYISLYEPTFMLEVNGRFTLYDYISLYEPTFMPEVGNLLRQLPPSRPHTRCAIDPK